MAFDFRTLPARLDAVGAATPGNARGRALEQLIAELFASVPGVEVEDRNVLGGSREAEFDIQFSNDQRPDGFAAFGRDFFVECKSSDDPLSAAGVQHFAGEMLKRRLPHSLIVSLKGITGDPETVSAAQRQIADYAIQQCWIMVLNERELRGISSSQHLVAVVERKRKVQLGRRTSAALNDADIAALRPTFGSGQTGRQAIEKAIRDARKAVLDEIFDAAEKGGEIDEARARARVAASAQALDADVERRRDDPEDDPLWHGTRALLIELAAALVRLAADSFDADIDLPKAIRFEVVNTAPQRLNAHVGSELWRLLVDHYLNGAMEEGAWRPLRSIYALIALITEEVQSIDDIDPADVFDLYDYTYTDGY